MPEVRIKKISLKSHYPKKKHKTYWRKKFTIIMGPSKFYRKAMVPMPSPTSALIKVSRIGIAYRAVDLGSIFRSHLGITLPCQGGTLGKEIMGKKTIPFTNLNGYRVVNILFSPFYPFRPCGEYFPFRRIFSIHPKWSWTVKRRSWPACPRITWATNLCFKTCQSQLHVTILAVWLSEHCIWFKPSRLLIVI